MNLPWPAPAYLLHGDGGLLVRFADRATGPAHRRVLAALRALQRAAVPGVRDLHPAYASILVEVDPLSAAPGDLLDRVRRTVEAAVDPGPGPSRTHDLPVRYGGEDGPDLEEVARLSGLSAAEVVRLHAGADYEVAFLGFAPGFPYLLGLPAALALPRLPSPRTRVPAGSVAIAGSQAGIYPCATAGGWRILGRTDAVLFDGAGARLAPGDTVRFLPEGGP